MSFGVDGALHLVGRQDDDEVGLLDGVGHVEHAQALGLGLGAGLRALGEPDAHVDPGVAQVQRVGVALAAVSDDRDLAALDDGQVGVVVVEHLGHRVGLSLCGVVVLRSWTVCGAAGLARAVSGSCRAADAVAGIRCAQALRSARSVMERGPRPMATSPDWTSSLTP